MSQISISQPYSGTIDLSSSSGGTIVIEDPASGASMVFPSLLSLAATLYNPTVIPGATLISPTVLVGTATFYPPTVTTEAQVVSPSILTANPTLYEPSITAGETIVNPSLLSTTGTVNEPSVSPGAVAVSPDLLTATVTIFDPTISTGVQTVSPTILTADPTLYEPTITTNVTVNPSVLAVSTTIHEPSITAGETIVNPSLLSATGTVNEPTVTTGETIVSPSILVGTANINEPSVSTGETTVNPSVLTGIASIYEPSVSPGAAIVSPNLLTASPTLYNPTAIVALALTSPAEGELPLGVKDIAYIGSTIVVSGGSGDYDFDDGGTLPSGMSINSSNGAISGTPTEALTLSQITITVTDNVAPVAPLVVNFLLTIFRRRDSFADMSQWTLIQTDGTIAASGGQAVSSGQTTPVYGDLSMYAPQETLADAIAMVTNFDLNSTDRIVIGFYPTTTIGSAPQWGFLTQSDIAFTIGAGITGTADSTPATSAWQVAIIATTSRMYVYLYNSGWRLLGLIPHAYTNTYEGIAWYDVGGVQDYNNGLTFDASVVAPAIAVASPTDGASGNAPSGDSVHMFRVTALPTSSNVIAYHFRKQDSNNFLSVEINASGDLTLYSTVAGSKISRGSSAATIAANDYIVISTLATAIQVYEGTVSGMPRRINWTSTAGLDAQVGYEVDYSTDGTITTLEIYPKLADTTLDAVLDKGATN